MPWQPRIPLEVFSSVCMPSYTLSAASIPRSLLSVVPFRGHRGELGAHGATKLVQFAVDVVGCPGGVRGVLCVWVRSVMLTFFMGNLCYSPWIVEGRGKVCVPSSQISFTGAIQRTDVVCSCMIRSVCPLTVYIAPVIRLRYRRDNRRIWFPWIDQRFSSVIHYPLSIINILSSIIHQFIIHHLK